MRREKNKKDRIKEYKSFSDNDSSIYYSEKQRQRKIGRVVHKKREEKEECEEREINGSDFKIYVIILMRYLLMLVWDQTGIR